MLTVPLQPVPSQAVTVVLGGQYCQISVYQRRMGLFLDLYVNNSLLLAGVICQNRNRIVRSVYIGFLGDLIFIDTQGSDDPVYGGLGGRFVLGYLAATELAALGLAA